MGQTRADQVRLNRMLKEYAADRLPHTEQVRFDMNWVLGLVARLDAELDKVKRTLNSQDR